MERSGRPTHHRARHRPQSRSGCHEVKEWIRKIVAFLFSHVGICVLVVGYIIMGAFAFMAIESEVEKKRYEDVVKMREETVQRLWRITYEFNVLYHDNWTMAIGDEVKGFQEQIVQAFLEGYDGNNNTRAAGQDGVKKWPFSAAFLYCLTVITTIGNSPPPSTIQI